MRRLGMTGGVIFGLVICSVAYSANVCEKLGPGEAEILYEFVDPDPAKGASPEGIAFDQTGNMYIGLRTYDGAAITANEVLKLTPWGEEMVLADFGPSGPGTFGVLGLETDPEGNVYAALASFNEKHGVWKVYPDGSMERLAGSENIMLPDGLTIDRKGNLYITDYDPFLLGTTGVWKYVKKEATCVPWIGGPLFEGGLNPLGDPMGGANGIVFDPPDNIYVGNTYQSTILHIPVLKDGSAGEVSLLAAGPPILNPDGMGVDAMGNVYVAIPASTFPDWFWDLFGGDPGTNPVVRIIPKTGEVQGVVDPAFPALEYFDFPTSLAFGKGPWDHKSVFLVGIGALNFGLPFGDVPLLTQVGVGMPGQTGQ